MIRTLDKKELLDARTWLHSFVAFVVLSVMLAVVPLTWNVVREYVTSAEYWFIYYDVYPAKSPYRIGSEMYFVSERRINQPMTFVWNDVLFCRVNGAFAHYSSYTSSRTHTKPTDGIQTMFWHYGGEVPTHETECYLESNVHAVFKHAPDKVQKLVGQPFPVRH